MSDERKLTFEDWCYLHSVLTVMKDRNEVIGNKIERLDEVLEKVRANRELQLYENLEKSGWETE